MKEYNLYSESEAKHTFSPSEPKTNADRIRSMTDEEIADFLASQTRIGASWWMDWLKLDPIDWTKRKEDGKDE